MTAEINTGLVLLGVLMMISTSVLRRNREASDYERLFFRAIELCGAALTASQVAGWEYLRANLMVRSMALYYVMLFVIGGTIFLIWEGVLTGIETIRHSNH